MGWLTRRAERAESKTRTVVLEEMRGIVDERLAEREPEPVVLSQEEKARLASAWAKVVCPYCGTIHAGLCGRVRSREVSFSPTGQLLHEKAVFWPDGEWLFNDGRITADDIWGGLAGAFNQAEEAKK